MKHWSTKYKISRHNKLNTQTITPATAEVLSGEYLFMTTSMDGHDEDRNRTEQNLIVYTLS